MLEKSKIKQILLDKSLGQILKVKRPIESIQQDENIIPLKSFSQHFHTTAGREVVTIPCFKTKIDQNSDKNWKFIRPRTPSISFNCKPRITIFDEKRDISQQQGLNISLSWEPIQKPIPLNKQTKRKPWFTLQVLHDSVADYQKQKSICFVNYSKAIQNKERPKYDHQIDDSKVAQAYLKLKPNYSKRYIDFAKVINRNNASPNLNKF
ncbi:unnamed protein product [Paramecium primaurelia]|uniref:Uncharacterized protein n=1 Tax=Paramecium primaurelia TaxID=5886 RepID=A0A8S1JW23_PARPR|nr:unnamed protein product [Paramecium primaurelia]